MSDIERTSNAAMANVEDSLQGQIQAFQREASAGQAGLPDEVTAEAFCLDGATLTGTAILVRSGFTIKSDSVSWSCTADPACPGCPALGRLETRTVLIPAVGMRGTIYE